MARTKHTPRKDVGGKGRKKNARSTRVRKASAAQSETSAPKALKHRRRRPGTVALREIRRYQKSTDLLIPKLPFGRLTHEILKDVTEEGAGYRLNCMAVEALQEASEAHMVSVLHDANLCCIHAVSYLFLVINAIMYRYSISCLSHTFHGCRSLTTEARNSYA